MKYVIDGKFLTQRMSGVQRYAYELIKALDKITDENIIEILVPECSTVVDVPFDNINVVHYGRHKGHIWEQIDFPMYAKKHKLIPICLCNAAPVIYPGIVCIHDVKVKVRPDDFNRLFVLWYNFVFKVISKKAKRIVTVSNFSKSEIEKFYPKHKADICVIPNSWQHYDLVSYDENALSKYGLEKDKYCFAMSNLDPNKNFKWIEEIAKKKENMTFAIAGMKNDKVFADRDSENKLSNVKYLGYVSDEEAKTLMRDCEAFLFPSFYEGFGIPPMEAIRAGAKIVIVSDIPVMHEIYQDCVNYINPLVYEYPENINQITEEKISDLLDRFSWDKSALLLKEILD